MHSPVHAHFESWSPPVGVIFALVLAALVYWRGWVRLRKAFPNAISVWQLGAFMSGLFSLWIALGSPLAVLDHYLLSIHMVEHVLLMTVAPPLILLGAPVLSLLHALPHRFVPLALRACLRRPLAWPGERRGLGDARGEWSRVHLITGGHQEAVQEGVGALRGDQTGAGPPCPSAAAGPGREQPLRYSAFTPDSRLPTPVSPRREGGGLGRVLSHPVLCWLAAMLALVGWHVPAVFALAVRSQSWHEVEYAGFFVTGVLFWWPVVQPWPSVARWPRWSIPLYLFLATLPCDALSAFLAFCDRVVYPSYLTAPRLFNISPLQDQQCAGALMWFCATFIYLIPAVVVTVQILSPARTHLAEQPEPRRRERPGGRLIPTWRSSEDVN